MSERDECLEIIDQLKLIDISKLEHHRGAIGPEQFSWEQFTIYYTLILEKLTEAFNRDISDKIMIVKVANVNTPKSDRYVTVVEPDVLGITAVLGGLLSAIMSLEYQNASRFLQMAINWTMMTGILPLNNLENAALHASTFGLKGQQGSIGSNGNERTGNVELIRYFNTIPVSEILESLTKSIIESEIYEKGCSISFVVPNIISWHEPHLTHDKAGAEAVMNSIIQKVKTLRIDESDIKILQFDLSIQNKETKNFEKLLSVIGDEKQPGYRIILARSNLWEYATSKIFIALKRNFKLLNEYQFSNKDDERQKQFSELQEKLVNDNETRVKKRLDELEYGYKLKSEELEKREYNVKQKEAYGRKETLATLLTSIKEKSKFELSEVANKKMRTILYTSWVLLVLSGICFGAWAFLEFKRCMQGGPIDYSTLAGTLLTTVFFVSSIIFFIRSHSQWAQVHINVELALIQLDMDMRRAAWLIDTMIEYKQTNPMMENMSKHLFELSINGMKTIEHPYDSIIGKVKSVEVSNGKSGVKINTGDKDSKNT